MFILSCIFFFLCSKEVIIQIKHHKMAKSTFHSLITFACVLSSAVFCTPVYFISSVFILANLWAPSKNVCSASWSLGSVAISTVLRYCALNAKGRRLFKAVVELRSNPCWSFKRWAPQCALQKTNPSLPVLPWTDSGFGSRTRVCLKGWRNVFVFVTSRTCFPTNPAIWEWRAALGDGTVQSLEWQRLSGWEAPGLLPPLGWGRGTSINPSGSGAVR